MKDIVVFDLDGTIADISHRLKYVQTSPPDWDRFFSECVNDIPKDWALELAVAMAAAGKQIHVVSARSQVVMLETQQWFAKHWAAVPSNQLTITLIRPDKDYTPDQILKKRWLDSSGIKDRILFIVDDRTRVVDMWRAEGLTCLQCDRWEEFKRPKKKCCDRDHNKDGNCDRHKEVASK